MTEPSATISTTGAPGATSPLLVVMLGLLFSMVAFPIDFCLPALPAIGEALDIDSRYAQLIISVTIFGYAGAHLPVGMLSDRFGRRRILLCSLLVYLIGAIGSSLAQTVPLLLLSRLLLGVGATAGPVLARAIVRDVATEAQGVRLLSAGFAITSSTLIFMPLLGSLVLELAGWRSVFLMTVLHGGIVLLFISRFLPETATTDHHRQHSVWYQAKRSFKQYFTNPQSVVPTAVLAFGFGGFFTFIATGSTITIEVYGLPATTYALLYMLPMGATALSAILVRRLVLRHKRRLLSRWAITIFVTSGAALGLLTIVSPVPSLWLLWPLIALYCFGYGMLLPMLTTAVLAPLPEVAGFVSSILGTLQFGMATVMSSVAALAYAGTARNMIVLMAVMAMLTGFVYLWGRKFIRLD